MYRRHFIKSSLGATAYIMMPRWDKKSKSMKPLKEGDTIAVITPGSHVPQDKMKEVVQRIKALGYKVQLGKYTDQLYGYTAGRDHERIADIHWAFSDPNIDAVWCGRGGYGCTRLLPYIDYKLLSRHPKPLIGYSDITALHNAFYHKMGWLGFHGPVGTTKHTDFTKNHLNILQNWDHVIPWQNEIPTEVIISGKAKGKLIGGNLSVLAAMAGTDYLPSAEGHIVMLEDIGEDPYRIDRMLTQLVQAMQLRKAKGIILGQFKDCDKQSKTSLTLGETINNHFAKLKVPVVYNFPFGHIDDMVTLPFGAEVELDTNLRILKAKI